MINIQEREEQGVMVFALEGRVDTQGAGDMDYALQSAVASGKTRIVLDMSRVAYISSAGLRTMADVLTRTTNAGGDLKLVSVSSRVARVLEIIGFMNFFSIYDSVQAAIADFN
ncbi:MAG: STAS domain-containing protein [bacterium]|jgi:anti-sigma B factor antagonist|nr:STAS domain-containing protein [bacterium]